MQGINITSPTIVWVILHPILRDLPFELWLTPLAQLVTNRDQYRALCGSMSSLVTPELLSIALPWATVKAVVSRSRAWNRGQVRVLSGSQSFSVRNDPGSG